MVDGHTYMKYKADLLNKGGNPTQKKNARIREHQLGIHWTHKDASFLIYNKIF